MKLVFKKSAYQHLFLVEVTNDIAFGWDNSFIEERVEWCREEFGEPCTNIDGANLPSQKWIYINHHFYFNNEEFAMLFKLVWIND